MIFCPYVIAAAFANIRKLRVVHERISQPLWVTKENKIGATQGPTRWVRTSSWLVTNLRTHQLRRMKGAFSLAGLIFLQSLGIDASHAVPSCRLMQAARFARWRITLQAWDPSHENSHPNNPQKLQALFSGMVIMTTRPWSQALPSNISDLINFVIQCTGLILATGSLLLWMIGWREALQSIKLLHIFCERAIVHRENFKYRRVPPSPFPKVLLFSW